MSVSVLIPARNEARCIRQALTSALAQEGVELEVVVLDDQSTDDTAAIVQALAARDPRVRLAFGTALPPGWCGKNYACHQLAQLARHDWLVFVDADVQLQPHALRRMVSFMEETGADLASGVPRQELVTFSERLLIPLIHFVLLGFLPMRRMRRSRSAAYAAGCGQLFVARAGAYHAAGGHAALRSSLHDGLHLPRVFRGQGWRTDLFDATELATCRMYPTDREVWAGLAKNASEGLGAPARIVPFTLLLGAGQVLPFVLVPFALVHSTEAALLALAASGLAWLPRFAGRRRFRQPLDSAWLHPLGVVALLGIQWFALVKFMTGRPAVWKGRAYDPGSAQAPTEGPVVFPAQGGRGVNAIRRGVLVAALALDVALSSGEPPAPTAAKNASPSTQVAPVEVEAPRQIETFELRDQHDRKRRIEFPRARICLVFIADQKGSKQLESWIRPLHERYGDRIDIEGIADVSAVPSPLRGMVRNAFRKQFARTVMLDWEGQVVRAFAYRKHVPNIYIVDTQGRIHLHTASLATESAVKALYEAVDRLLSAPPPSRLLPLK